MNTLNLYRVWCPHEDEWAEVWASEPPTTSPLQSGNPIDESKTYIVDSLSQQFPVSYVGNKIWVHSSPRPQPTPTANYSIYWTGAGDDCVNHIIGDGTPTDFNLPAVTEPADTYYNVYFDPLFGPVYLHNGFVAWSGISGRGNHLSVEVIALATPVQQIQNFIGVVVDYMLVPSTTPDTGLAGMPTLIDTMDQNGICSGWWDYSPSAGLTPNFLQKGNYNIMTIELLVSRFINRLYMYETSSEYISLQSTDSTLLPPGYYLRFCIHNNSSTAWNCHVLMHLFREQTCNIGPT